MMIFIPLIFLIDFGAGDGIQIFATTLAGVSSAHQLSGSSITRLEGNNGRKPAVEARVALPELCYF
jgi:hypothetical protein